MSLYILLKKFCLLLLYSFLLFYTIRVSHLYTFSLIPSYLKPYLSHPLQMLSYFLHITSNQFFFGPPLPRFPTALLFHSYYLFPRYCLFFRQVRTVFIYFLVFRRLYSLLLIFFLYIYSLLYIT